MAKIIEMNSGDRAGNLDVQNEEQPAELDLNHLTATLDYIAPILRQMDRTKMAENIRIRENLVAEESDNDLIGRLNGSTESDWMDHPTYFSAIINILRGRGVIKR